MKGRISINLSISLDTEVSVALINQLADLIGCCLGVAILPGIWLTALISPVTLQGIPIGLGY